MPKRAPRICGCGQVIPDGLVCKPCETKRKAVAEANRPNAHDRGYDHEWRAAAKEFLSQHLHCAHCKTEFATVVDHIIPHKGDPKLFWDQSNWQALCRHCHNSSKQSRERRKSRFGGILGLRCGWLGCQW